MSKDAEWDDLAAPSHPIWKILMGLVAVLAALWGVTQ